MASSLCVAPPRWAKMWRHYSKKYWDPKESKHFSLRKDTKSSFGLLEIVAPYSNLL